MQQHNDALRLSPAGLHRRLKRRLLKSECRFFAICTPGLEKMLLSELEQIPEVSQPTTVHGGIEFSGPLDLIYSTNLHLRTATRILLRIETFKIKSYPELYNKVRRIDWELYLGFASMVCVEVAAKQSRLHHEKNIAQAVYDGIKESMMALGVPVEVSEKSPLQVHVRFFDDVCTVSMDSSGDPLYKRGYREVTAKAPIRENLAAALLMAAQCHGYPIVADPFCGSGTFLIEAALMSRRVAPGLGRSFAFTAWPSFHESKWERLKAKAQSDILPQASQKLWGGDHLQGALRAATSNATRAGVAQDIQFSRADCRVFNKDGQWGNTGLIISNPPYGKRIGDRHLVKTLFREWGRALREDCKGWSYGLVIADPAFVRSAGLSPHTEIPFSNGGIDVRFVIGRI